MTQKYALRIKQARKNQNILLKMNNKVNKSLILNKIKEHYNFGSDTAFAKFLGIKPQTLSSWHSRNSFDIDLIYAKCVNINSDFLLSGEGEVEKPNVEEDVINENDNFFDNLNDTKRNVKEKVIKYKKSEKKSMTSEKMEYLQNLVTEAKAKSERKMIPLYGVTTIGGAREVADVNSAVTQPEGYIEVGGWFPGATDAIYHYGESMKEYPSGCILILKRLYNARNIVWGNNYVVETDEIRVTKRLQSCKDDDTCVMAYSSNQERYEDGTLIYEPFKIYKEDIKRILLVISSINREQMTAPMKLIQVKK